LRFSIVSAVYNVERFLGAFIDAVEAQTFPADRFEVILVDDGSTDGTPGLLASWAARRPDLVRVFTKENGGQGEARTSVSTTPAATGSRSPIPTT
jgi:glycosyltransferase involved in cell wall biosynthesis